MSFIPAHIFSEKKTLSEYKALYQILHTLDLGFVEKILSRNYGRRSTVGRPHRNLLGMLKAELVKRLRHIESYEELYRLLWSDENLSSLCDIESSQKPYHPSTLLRFRRRIGPHGFQHLMTHLIKMIDKMGVIDAETVAVDTTFIKAYSSRDPHDNRRGLSDPDARLRKQGRNVTLGYGIHLAVDTKSEMPLATIIEPANTNEKKVAPTLIHKTVKQKRSIKNVVADSQYSSEAFRDQVRRRGGEPVIPYPKNQMKGKPVLRVDRKFRSHGPAHLKKFYRQRSAVERTFSRLKTHFGLSQLRTRGLRNVIVHVSICLVAMLATALSAVKQTCIHKLRSPVQFIKLTRRI